MTTRTAANTRSRRPRTARRTTTQPQETPQYKIEHGRQCACGSYVMDEVDPQDLQKHAYDFELVETLRLVDTDDEPCFRMWKHQCAKAA